MKMKIILGLCAAIGIASAAVAQTNTPPSNAPGQKMLDAREKNLKSTGPGASEYAPGHLKQNETKSTGPGASTYAPGQANKATTGSSNSRK